MKAILVAISISFCLQLSAQYQIDIDINVLVDTTDAEVKSVFELYRNYLLHRPDSIQPGSLYWREENKKKFDDFDFIRYALYGAGGMSFVSSLYRFGILNIEKEKDAYSIKTAIIARSPDSLIKEQDPYSVVKIYAVKEGNSWKLKNAFDFVTKNWVVQKEGNITYHYPCDVKPPDAEFKKSRKFCDSVARLLEVDMWEPFDYYIASTPDEMRHLLGFDYALINARGMAFRTNILLNGIGSAYYPHEFVHHVAQDKHIKHYMINEGLATWLGGSLGQTFEERLTVLAKAVAENDSVKVDDVINMRWGWGKVNAQYTTGGLFCKLVYQKWGLVGLTLLFSIPVADNKLLKGKLMELLETKDLDAIWKKELIKYLRRD